MEPRKAVSRDDLPVPHRTVVDILGHGRNNALTSAKVRQYIVSRSGTKMSHRTLRIIVKELVEEYGWPIGSSPKAPAGFFVVDSRTEHEENIRGLMARAYSILYRVSKLRNISIKQAYDQMVLEFGRVDDGKS